MSPNKDGILIIHFHRSPLTIHYLCTIKFLILKANTVFSGQHIVAS